MSKAELIEFVKHQTNVELSNDEHPLNRKRKILYTQIKRNDYSNVMPALIKKGIRAENHIKDYYFITL